MIAVDKGLYLTQHLGLTAVLEPLMRAWHFLLDPTTKRLEKEEQRTLERRYRSLLQRDLDNVARGLYPRELLFQLPVGKILKKLPVGLVEFPRIYRRRASQKFDDLPEIPRPGSYPDYYRRTFHWQTDGWLSDRSADLYDVSVETLFLGTADIMRRMTIPPVLEAAREMEQPRILDVACGTGRFLQQIHLARPDAKLYGLDLSPNYLEKAKQVLRDVGGVSLVADNAEEMPFKDATFDVVTSVFLFHELPSDARRNVMREALRVLRPGGTFVVNDSAQLSDSGELSAVLERFPKLYHEPYFKGYLRDDLEKALASVGFDVDRTESHFVSKVVVARKPQPAAS